jgi:hypothetical protein
MLEITNLFILAGFLIWAIVLFRNYLRSRRRTATAQGTVLAVRFGRQPTKVQRPEIEFVDSRGQKFKFHSLIGASWNPWPAGSTVQVFYDPKDPTNAEIKPTAGMIVFVVCIGAIVLGFWLYGVLRN